ncbi:DC1 [Arabidopsis suecica]|uniref:DC1 n=1 Tax=Arabidopsis suecica TaxID=45249 RepID=A0A8T2DLR8_ARASU|nr:DC1 [Arabidopsis suecica]
MDVGRCPTCQSPLKYTKLSSKCDACYEDHHDNKQGYKCDYCSFCLHDECINANLPSRHKHPLKVTNSYNSKLCHLCETKRYPQILYQCSQCSFSICIPCARKPIIFDQTKAHDHELVQVMIKLPFTCDACGLCSTEYPCLCLQCCFMIHRACIFLPRVIYINRHDHRISHVSSLSPGKWICRVCYEHVNEDYGAYACSICSYFFHSKCATNTNIWDGRELEGVPEEDEKEEIKPFEVIDQTLIKHFTHEHNLKASISSSRLEEPRERCCACTLPFYSEMCYKCTQCDFILHDSCANLPLKKRHEISTHKLMLCTKSQLGANFENSFFCVTCQRYCTGFSYNITGDENNTQHSIDVRCASISDAFKHESHPHWLFVFFDLFYSRCEGCDLNCWFYLRCKDKDDCGCYNLCFTCATLPTLVRDKYDDHPLSLCYGEKNVNARYCCGICEEDVHSKSWFYKCNECGSTLHTKCVFQNLIHSRSGYSLVIGNKGSFDLLPNNRLSRPICYLCKIRCMGDFVLHKKADTSIFICCSCGFNYKDLVRRY